MMARNVILSGSEESGAEPWNGASDPSLRLVAVFRMTEGRDYGPRTRHFRISLNVNTL